MPFMQLPYGNDYHVHFICEDKDLDYIKPAVNHLRNQGYQCIDLSEAPHGGKTDVYYFDRFTSRSMWNVLVVSSVTTDKVMFQQHVAIDTARWNRTANIVVLHAQKNLENFLSPLLCSFQQVFHDENWISNLTSVISKSPAHFKQLEKRCFDERHKGIVDYLNVNQGEDLDRLWKSDEIERVRRFEKKRRPILTSIQILYQKRKSIKWPRL